MLFRSFTFDSILAVCLFVCNVFFPLLGEGDDSRGLICDFVSLASTIFFMRDFFLSVVGVCFGDEFDDKCFFRRGDGEGDLDTRFLARSNISLLLLVVEVLLLLPVDLKEASDGSRNAPIASFFSSPTVVLCFSIILLLSRKLLMGLSFLTSFLDAISFSVEGPSTFSLFPGEDDSVFAEEEFFLEAWAIFLTDASFLLLGEGATVF